jgi:hypothetical protein
MTTINVKSRISVKPVRLYVQVLYDDTMFDATGRNKKEQAFLLSFSILLSIAGFIISVLDTKIVMQYAMETASRVAANVSEYASQAWRSTEHSQNNDTKSDSQADGEHVDAHASTAGYHLDIQH